MATPQNLNLNTYGDLKKLLKYIQLKQKGGKLLVAGKNLAIDQILGLLPGGNNIKSGFDFIKTMFSKPDTVKTNTWLDRLDIDDQVAAIVDDSVENKFLQVMAKALKTTPDNTPLESNFDMNKTMAKFLKNKYSNRFVAGIPENISEVTSQQKTADLKAANARITAIKEKIKAATLELQQAQKELQNKTSQIVTTENIDDFIDLEYSYDDLDGLNADSLMNIASKLKIPVGDKSVEQLKKEIVRTKEKDLGGMTKNDLKKYTDMDKIKELKQALLPLIKEVLSENSFEEMLNMFPADLVKGEQYIWFMGTEPLPCTYLGKGEKPMTFKFQLDKSTHILSYGDVRKYIFEKQRVDEVVDYDKVTIKIGDNVIINAGKFKNAKGKVISFVNRQYGINAYKVDINGTKAIIFPTDIKKDNTIKETIGHTYDTIADSIYKEFKKDKNWEHEAKLSLKDEWGVNKEEYERILDMLHGEDYFDDGIIGFDDDFDEPINESNLGIMSDPIPTTKSGLINIFNGLLNRGQYGSFTLKDSKELIQSYIKLGGSLTELKNILSRQGINPLAVDNLAKGYTKVSNPNATLKPSAIPDFSWKLNEVRIESPDIEYEFDSKKEKVIAYLKQQKASRFTKFIQTLLDLEAKMDDLKKIKQELNDELNLKKADYDVQDTTITEAVLDLFDAAESAQTLVVDCLGSTLTLAKKTPDVTVVTTNTDFKKAWDMCYALFASPELGLQNKLDEIVNECTAISTEIKTKKRALRPKLKGENIIRESIFDSIRTFVGSIFGWAKSFGKKQKAVDSYISKL